MSDERGDTVRVAASPINWCNDDLTDLGDAYAVETIWAEMAAAGVTGTEMGRKYPRDPAILGERLKAHGLQLVAGWATVHLARRDQWADALAAYDRHVAFLAAMGAEAAVTCDGSGSVQWDRGGERPAVIPWDDAAWRNVAEGLNLAGRRAADRGVRLVYHPHLGTNIQDPAAIDRLMAMTDSTAVGVCLDTGHVAAAGGDPLEVLRRYGNRVGHIHLKDVRPREVEAFRQGRPFLEAVRHGIFTVPGDGAIDFGPFLAELRRARYRGWVVIEAEQDPELAPPLPYLKRALRYVRAGLGAGPGVVE